MPRTVIQKNLSYDSDRRLYYVIFHDGSDGHSHRRRHTRTFAAFPDALAAQLSGDDDRLPRPSLPRTGCPCGPG